MDLAKVIQEAPPSAGFKRNLLKAQMTLQSISCKNLADAEGWSLTTAYRKVNGKTAWTVPEVQVCVELLSLDSVVASNIFLPEKCPKGQI